MTEREQALVQETTACVLVELGLHASFGSPDFWPALSHDDRCEVTQLVRAAPGMRAYRPATLDIQLALDVVFDPRPDQRGRVLVDAVVTTERVVALGVNAN